MVLVTYFISKQLGLLIGLIVFLLILFLDFYLLILLSLSVLYLFVAYLKVEKADGLFFSIRTAEGFDILAHHKQNKLQT